MATGRNIEVEKYLDEHPYRMLYVLLLSKVKLTQQGDVTKHS